MHPTALLRVTFLILAIAAFIASAFIAPLPLIVAGVVASLVFATSFGPAGKSAGHLGDLTGQEARVSLWGNPLDPGRSLRIRSVWALGAGLHFVFDHGAGSARIHVKVAQPTGVSLGEESIIVENAKYIQVSGRKQARDPQRPALALELSPRQA
jgi:hypothetical protein